MSYHKQVQTKGGRCKSCGGLTTYTRANSEAGLCMKCESEKREAKKICRLCNKPILKPKKKSDEFYGQPYYNLFKVKGRSPIARNKKFNFHHEYEHRDQWCMRLPNWNETINVPEGSHSMSITENGVHFHFGKLNAQPMEVIELEPMPPDTQAFAETIKVMNNWSIKNMNSLKELVQHINRLAPGSLVVVDTCGANCANTQRQWLTKELQACGIPMRDSSTFDILLGNGTKICLVGPHYDRNNKDASREITMRISCVEIDRLDRLSRNPVPPYRAPNVWVPGITEQVLFEAKAESVNRTTIKLPCGCYNITRWNYNVARGLLIEEAVEDENLCKMHVVSQNVKEVMRDIAKELAKNFIQK